MLVSAAKNPYLGPIILTDYETVFVMNLSFFNLSPAALFRYLSRAVTGQSLLRRQKDVDPAKQRRFEEVEQASRELRGSLKGLADSMSCNIRFSFEQEGDILRIATNLKFMTPGHLYVSGLLTGSYWHVGLSAGYDGDEIKGILHTAEGHTVFDLQDRQEIAQILSTLRELSCKPNRVRKYGGFCPETGFSNFFRNPYGGLMPIGFAGPEKPLPTSPASFFAANAA